MPRRCRGKGRRRCRTRAPPAAAGGRKKKRRKRIILTDLPTDVLQHIVVRLTLAHDIARAAPTCRAISVAARNAFRVRPFSRAVVTLAGHASNVFCVAAAPDGRVITGSHDSTIKVWRDGACERTIQTHTQTVTAVLERAVRNA